MRIMKKILFAVFIIPTIIFAQCPGATAISYKNKAQNLGAKEFSKREAYIWLATYYAYKCECDNGSPRAQQLVSMINRVVDTYSAYTKNAYGTISKVSSCKSQDGSGNSNTTGDTGNPNASDHGSGKYFDLGTKEIEDAARQILGDSSIVTKQLAAFNAGQDLGYSIKNNTNISENLENVSQIVFGENSEITKSISNFNLGKSYAQSIKNNDLSGMLSYGIQLQALLNDDYTLDKEESEKLKSDFFEYLRKSKKNANALIVKNENEVLNQIDISQSIQILSNKNINVNKKSNDLFEIVSNKKVSRKEMIAKDNIFLEIESSNLSINKDFKIEFQLGLKKNKIFLTSNLALACLKVYISNGNVLEFSPYTSTVKYSFSPWLNDKFNGDGEYIYENRMEWIKEISKELNIQELDKMIFSGMRDMGPYQNLSRKEYKKLRKELVKEIENSNKIDKWYFDKVTIIKENDEIKAKREYFDILTKKQYSSEIVIPYDFLFENKIFFGLSSIGTFPLPKSFELQIKDLKISK